MHPSSTQFCSPRPRVDDLNLVPSTSSMGVSSFTSSPSFFTVVLCSLAFPDGLCFRRNRRFFLVFFAPFGWKSESSESENARFASSCHSSSSSLSSSSTSTPNAASIAALGGDGGGVSCSCSSPRCSPRSASAAARVSLRRLPRSLIFPKCCFPQGFEPLRHRSLAENRHNDHHSLRKLGATTCKWTRTARETARRVVDDEESRQGRTTGVYPCRTPQAQPLGRLVTSLRAGRTATVSDEYVRWAVHLNRASTVRLFPPESLKLATSMRRGGRRHLSRRWRLVRTMSASFQWREGSEGVREASVARFNAFLQRVREQVNGVTKGTRVHVMIGNEAADADSIVSSLVYAYFRDYVAMEEREPKLFVPVLPIPRDELPLRCDVVALFQGLRIDTSSIFFVDEFPWRHEAFQTTAGERSLHMTLLDHNALNTKRIAEGLVAEDMGRIMEILDHHMDLGKHMEAPAREIAFQQDQALVASSCTLIAEKILAYAATKKVDQEVLALTATMLLGVIALDSINFDPSAKKVTPRDVAAADHLEVASFAQKGDLFRWLQSEKFNVAHWGAFSLNNCLVCDYKEFQLPEGASGKYGVSAILIPLETFVTKAKTADDFVGQLQTYCEKDDLAFLVVMTMTVNADGDRKRQILFYEADDQAHTKRCLHYFKSNDVLQLEPTGLPYQFDERVSAFQQHNTGASRKQVVPLIQLALGTVAQVKL